MSMHLSGLFTKVAPDRMQHCSCLGRDCCVAVEASLCTFRAEVLQSGGAANVTGVCGV